MSNMTDLIYLNRFGFELPKQLQTEWGTLYARATDDEGKQHLSIQYNNFVEQIILSFKKTGGVEYVPLEHVKRCNYKPLTIYTYVADTDDTTYVYRCFNQYLKDHQAELNVSIEQDRKLAMDAVRYAKLKTVDNCTPKTYKPINPDYWYQYWDKHGEGVKYFEN